MAKTAKAKTLYVTNREDWRTWLEKNHDTAKEIWLIYYKKHSGKPRKTAPGRILRHRGARLRSHRT